MKRFLETLNMALKMTGYKVGSSGAPLLEFILRLNGYEEGHVMTFAESWEYCKGLRKRLLGG